MSDTIWTKMGRLTETLTEVSKKLTAHGWPTTVDYPGFLTIEVPEAPEGYADLWNVGTANENWGGEGYLHYPERQEGTGPCLYVDTDVPSNSDDVDRIAAVLIAGIERAYQTAHQQDDPHCTCPDCQMCLEAEQNAHGLR